MDAVLQVEPLNNFHRKLSCYLGENVSTEQSLRYLIVVVWWRRAKADDWKEWIKYDEAFCPENVQFNKSLKVKAGFDRNVFVQANLLAHEIADETCNKVRMDTAN